MRRILPYVLTLLVVLSSAAGCASKGRIIPKKKMMRIYTEMFLTDQWLRDNPDARKVADTTLVFEPIFRKYGYTFKDYDRSVKHYLEQPEEFSKMFTEIATQMQKHADEYREELKHQQAVKERLDSLAGTYFYHDMSTDSSRWSGPQTLWPVYVDTIIDTMMVKADSASVSGTQAHKAPAFDEAQLELDELESASDWRPATSRTRKPAENRTEPAAKRQLKRL